MKKLFVFVTICVILLVSCSPKPVDKTGVTLRCAFIGYGDYEKLYKEIDKFTNSTGIDVEIVYLDNHFELDKKLKKDFETGSVNYDVISNHSSFYTQYLDYLEPLNDYFTPEELSDFLPRLLNSGKQNGNYYLIPRHADISALLYRTDLFEDSANKEEYKKIYNKDLKYPETWEEFEQIALFFKDKGVYGTAFAGKEEALTGRFYEILVANGGKFIDSNNYAVFNSNAGIKTADMLKNLYEQGAMPPDTFNYLWDDVAKKFAVGEVAMYLEWNNYYSFFQDEKRSNVAGNFDVARQPEGAGGIHSGWLGLHGFSVTKSSSHKEEAVELIKFLTNEDNEMIEAEIGYLPARTSIFEKIIEKSKFDPLNQKRLQIAKIQLAEDSFSPPLIPEWITASDILYPVLQQIMAGEISSSDGLNMAAEQINEMFN